MAVVAGVDFGTLSVRVSIVDSDGPDLVARNAGFLQCRAGRGAERLHVVMV